LGLLENLFALPLARDPLPGGFDFESPDTGKDFDLYPSVDGCVLTLDDKLDVNSWVCISYRSRYGARPREMAPRCISFIEKDGYCENSPEIVARWTDRKARSVSNFPNVALEDEISPDIEDGHEGCRGLSEGGEAVRNRYGV
jgi:hypothetical protein